MIRFLDTSAACAPYDGALRAGASLESAVRRPEFLHHYADESDPVVLAAALLWAVNRTHPLIDGNKRASVMLADAFLTENDRHLDGSEDQLVELVLGAASGALDEALLPTVMRSLCHPGVPGELFAVRHPGVIARLAL